MGQELRKGDEYREVVSRDGKVPKVSKGKTNNPLDTPDTFPRL